MEIQEQRTAVASVKSTDLFTIGFALFSMFFGAGNLIFPLLIGKTTGENWGYATLGLGLTAVIVPFLGLAGMIFFQADYKRFFGRIGKIPGFLLLLLLQLILGPFGVIPRLITLMHAIIKPYFFNLPLPLFSILAAAAIFLFSFRKQNILKLLGVILTPILLISLASLFFSAAVLSPSPSTIQQPSIWDSFSQGILGGYNTMDLIAAFLFATVVLPFFQKDKDLDFSLDKKKSLPRKMFLSSLIAASLLLFSYVGLCFTAAHHGTSTGSLLRNEELLGAIAFQLLGPMGGCIAAVAIVTACLTTAITLTSIFANYLQTDLFQEKAAPISTLTITLLISICFANIGFTGISAFLGPILQICYPGLIVLTILNIAHYLTGFKPIKTPVFLTFIISTLIYLI